MRYLTLIMTVSVLSFGAAGSYGEEGVITEFVGTATYKFKDRRFKDFLNAHLYLATVSARG
ncbi:MAG: hypothetical protein AB7G93_12925 [Bdellovibrionales bacterium]